jgi:thiol-disulfide isomerase/thioredoxin
MYKSLLVAAAVMLSTAQCYSQSLKVGSKAPALKVSRWVKGEGPSKLEPGKVYVVEFWATWCGPCRTTIPHLTKMAHKYKDRVTFIGVSVWEGEFNKVVHNRVDSFVGEMGDKMDYLVARDTATNHIARTWLDAAGIGSIPSAIIVDGDGKIAWIGHPMYDMDKAIDEVLAKAK